MARRTQFEIWEETFQPLQNHLDEDAGIDGCMFETFGAEMDYVQAALKANPNGVWTVVEGDSGKWYISQGYHFINRVGYLVTKNPFDPANPQHVTRFQQRDTFYL